MSDAEIFSLLPVASLEVGVLKVLIELKHSYSLPGNRRNRIDGFSDNNRNDGYIREVLQGREPRTQEGEK